MNRLDSVGIIKIEQYSVVYMGTYPKQPHSDISFNQANKKDATNITRGAYTLSTTKKGRVVHNPELVCGIPFPHYKRAGYISEVSVKYMMGHSLEEKGLQLVSPPWEVTTTAKISYNPAP